ncbi:MAG: type II toxin-antitoxin system RelE/ParE family toxin [Actinomycetota bacterium]|nr:type II toxin-antitoxin system RelE/ParE family toxin [Actinomycetota bacterium]
MVEPDDQSRYTLLLAPGARRALTDVLPETAAFAAREFISGPLARDPHRVGAPLLAPFEGQWCARRGEYRVRYGIDGASRTVRVLDIDHRWEAYRA